MKTPQFLERIAKTLGWLILCTLLGMLGWWLASHIWKRYGPSPERLTEVQRSLVERWLPDVVADLKAARGANRSVLVPHLAGDPSGEVTDNLRNRIRTSGVLWVNPRSFQTVIREAVDDLHRALRLQVDSPKTIEQACAWARGLEVDTVLIGRVHRLEGDAQEAQLDVELCLVNAGSAEVLYTRRYRSSWHPALGEPATIRDAVASWTPAERFLAWALMGLLLPVVLWPIVRAVVRCESNGANAVLLGILTATQAGAAWLLLAARPASWWSVALFLVLLTIACFYNLRVMTFALDRGHE